MKPYFSLKRPQFLNVFDDSRELISKYAPCTLSLLKIQQLFDIIAYQLKSYGWRPGFNRPRGNEENNGLRPEAPVQSPFFTKDKNSRGVTIWNRNLRRSAARIRGLPCDRPFAH